MTGVELWALGCAPVGIVDGEFVVYVPSIDATRASGAGEGER